VTQRLTVHPDNPPLRKIRMAVDELRKGGVVAYPTDTMYALGVDATQRKAVDRVYAMKRMDRDQPLAFLCADLSDIARWAIVEKDAYRVMKRLTPGPYVFILKATREVPRMLVQKRKTIGIRVPDHPVPHALLAELGGPVVSTSATWDDQPLADPDEILDRYRQLDVLLDSGPGGLEPSTVLDLSNDVLEVVREGAGPVDDL